MNSLARILAPIAVLIAGVFVAAGFMLTKPTADRTTSEALPPRVEFLDFQRTSRPAEVSALGTLVPAERVAMQPEVSGAVRFVAPGLVPGGIVGKGTVLVRVDARNYRIAVEQQRANLARAEQELQLERGRQRVAKREWNLLQGSTKGEADEALALRKPQLANAKASLSAARSALERAQIDLARTAVRAPFDAVVREKSVALGQVVQPNVSMATLVGTSVFWVQVSLPLADLARIRAPNTKGEGGSKVQVVQALGETQTVEREGRVIRVLGDLDPVGKMARVLVEVRDPLNLKQDGQFPLLLGSVVRVRIEGDVLSDVYAIPRVALREGGKLWLVADSKLDVRDVEVVYRGREEVYVRGEFAETLRVITSRLPAPVHGMAVRVEGTSASAEVP